MYVDLLVLNSAAAAIFFLMFFGMMKAHSDQFVSPFWGAVDKEAGTMTYFIVMWLSAVIATLPLLASDSPGYTVGRFAAQQLQQGDVFTGALVFTLWGLGTLFAAIFAVGVTVYAQYAGLRRILRLPKGPTVVG